MLKSLFRKREEYKKGKEICTHVSVHVLRTKIFGTMKEKDQSQEIKRGNGFSRKIMSINIHSCISSRKHLLLDGLMSSMTNKYPTEIKTGITKEKKITSGVSLNLLEC